VFGNDLKYDYIIAYINDKHDYVKVGGYFINISTEDVDKLYKLKNRFEVLQKSSDMIGS
jgi:exo-beta-1,3-glucanase (GH17 family)